VRWRQAPPGLEPAAGPLSLSPVQPGSFRLRGGVGFVNKFLLPFAVFAVFIGGWYLVTWLALTPQQRFMLPYPHQVVNVGLLDWSNLKDILEALKYTGVVTFIGWASRSCLAWPRRS